MVGERILFRGIRGGAFGSRPVPSAFVGVPVTRKTVLEVYGASRFCFSDANAYSLNPGSDDRDDNFDGMRK
jgi:hypothetical protein